MSLKLFEVKWKAVLSSILEELDEPQFRKLLSLLERIPQGVRNSKVREEMPQTIIQYYGVEESISIMQKAMDQWIPRRDAAVQDLLRPMVDKLKSERQKKRQGKMVNPVGDEGAAAKKQKAPAGQQKASQPDKKKAPAGNAEQNAPKTSLVKRKAESAGPAKPKQKQRKGPNPTGFTQTAKTDAAGPVKPKQPEGQDPTGFTKTLKVQSTPVQTGIIKIIAVRSANKINTHLVAEFNQQMQPFFVTSRCLAKAFGFNLEDDIKLRLLEEMPLLAVAKIQGNKITEIKKN